MGAFSSYLRLGYEHIISMQAMDHLIFILALVATYQFKHWLRLIIAVSLFTLGHSISLTLGAWDLIKINADLIEFAIPLTILLTALYNLTRAGQRQRKSKYYIALLFGLIHGLGFANYYQMLTMGENTYWQALLPFNLGVELGQLVVVVAVLIFLLVYEIILNKKARDWNLFISGAAFGLSFLMCLETWPFGSL